MVVLELYLEHMKWGNVCTASTIVHNISLDSLKTFVLEPNEVTGTTRQQKSLYEQNKYSRFVHDTDRSNCQRTKSSVDYFRTRIK